MFGHLRNTKCNKWWSSFGLWEKHLSMTAWLIVGTEIQNVCEPVFQSLSALSGCNTKLQQYPFKTSYIPHGLFSCTAFSALSGFSCSDEQSRKNVSVPILVLCILCQGLFLFNPVALLFFIKLSSQHSELLLILCVRTKRFLILRETFWPALSVCTQDLLFFTISIPWMAA